MLISIGKIFADLENITEWVMKPFSLNYFLNRKFFPGFDIGAAQADTQSFQSINQGFQSFTPNHFKDCQGWFFGAYAILTRRANAGGTSIFTWTIFDQLNSILNTILIVVK